MEIGEEKSSEEKFSILYDRRYTLRQQLEASTVAETNRANMDKI